MSTLTNTSVELSAGTDSPFSSIGAATKAWTDLLINGGSPLLAVTGSKQFRASVFAACGESSGLQWIVKGPHAYTMSRIRNVTGDPWGLLWNLVRGPDLICFGPLASNPRYQSCLDVVREAWTMIGEGRRREAAPLLVALLRWVSGKDLTCAQRDALFRLGITHSLVGLEACLDMHMFLLSLAFQNGVVDETVVVLDDLDQILESDETELVNQLRSVVRLAETWSNRGAAIGFMFGVSATGLDALTRRYPNFAPIARSLV